MAMNKMKTHARGIGSVEEMKDHMDENTVMFGMLRFVFGHGSFARVKFVFIHLNGEGCPTVKRGRFNAKKGEAGDQIGACHTSLEYKTPDEITVDGVLEHLFNVCVSDGGLGKGTEMTVDQMKKDMEVMIEKAHEELEALQEAPAPVDKSPGPMRGIMWKDMTIKPSWSEVLQMVRADMGPFNWMLLKPDARMPEVVNAGSGSVTQMRDELEDNQVYYGLVRMGFGTGQFRRSKWIYIHWSGENVPAMKRGKYNAEDGDMNIMLGSHNVAVAAQSMDEFTLEEVIKKVQKAVVTDGDATETDLFSMDGFLAALEEEQREIEAGSDELEDASPASPSPSAVIGIPEQPPLMDGIESVRSDRQPYNWLLCSFG